MDTRSSPEDPIRPAVFPPRPHPLLTRYYSDEQERRRRVESWFDRSAAHYNFITQAMSFGTGHWHRRQALLRAGLVEGMSALDVACGTGVLAAHARDIVGARGFVCGLDPSARMLDEARGRGVGALARGVAEALPLDSGRFDFVSMGYALRHVADLGATFSEYRRVLRPGGRLLVLEITPPASRIGFQLLKIYLSRVVPAFVRVGGGGTAGQELMAYFWDTIESCVPPAAILEAIRQAGFSGAQRRATLGVVSEYTAVG